MYKVNINNKNMIICMLLLRSSNSGSQQHITFVGSIEGQCVLPDKCGQRASRVIRSFKGQMARVIIEQPPPQKAKLCLEH